MLYAHVAGPLIIKNLTAMPINIVLCVGIDYIYILPNNEFELNGRQHEWNNEEDHDKMSILIRISYIGTLCDVYV